MGLPDHPFLLSFRVQNDNKNLAVIISGNNVIHLKAFQYNSAPGSAGHYFNGYWNFTFYFPFRLMDGQLNWVVKNEQHYSR